MAYLKISCGDLSLEIDKISQYNLSEFSLKNQYTGENGNTIIYPVRMHKKRISVTAELSGSAGLPSEITEYSGEYEYFMSIVKNPEFVCEYKTPYKNELFFGIFTITSDITMTKIIAENPIIYAVSFTLEEV